MAFGSKYFGKYQSASEKNKWYRISSLSNQRNTARQMIQNADARKAREDREKRERAASQRLSLMEFKTRERESGVHDRPGRLRDFLTAQATPKVSVGAIPIAGYDTASPAELEAERDAEAIQKRE